MSEDDGACPTCKGSGWDYAQPSPGEAAGVTLCCPSCGGAGRTPTWDEIWDLGLRRGPSAIFYAGQLDALQRAIRIVREEGYGCEVAPVTIDLTVERLTRLSEALEQIRPAPERGAHGKHRDGTDVDPDDDAWGALCAALGRERNASFEELSEAAIELSESCGNMHHKLRSAVSLAVYFKHWAKENDEESRSHLSACVAAILDDEDA